MQPRALLLDLDGTLVDSSFGITACNLHALECMQVQPPSPEVLRSWLGPPLRRNFATLFDDPAQVEQAVALYRARYDSDGWRAYTVYPGIEDALRAQHARGTRLLVVTSKNEPHARQVVDSLPFGDLFEEVVGDTLDGALGSKALLIGDALRRSGMQATHAVMVGDRDLDVLGARAHGMPGIGVLWGFGSAGELLAAGATQLLRQPAQLAALTAA